MTSLVHRDSNPINPTPNRQDHNHASCPLFLKVQYRAPSNIISVRCQFVVEFGEFGLVETFYRIEVRRINEKTKPKKTSQISKTCEVYL